MGDCRLHMRVHLTVRIHIDRSTFCSVELLRVEFQQYKVKIKLKIWLKNTNELSVQPSIVPDHSGSTNWDALNVAKVTNQPLM